MKKILFVCSLLYILSSCASFKEPEFRGSEGVKLEKMEGKKIAFSAGIKVFNPNWFGIKIKPSNLDVYLEDQYMGKVYLEKKVKMKAKQESSLSMQLRAELADGAMITLLKYSNKENVSVHLKGKVKGGIWIFSKKFEIDETKNVSGKDLKFNGNR